MAQAQKGDQVTVHYTGKLADSTIFDSSVDTDPITFTLGEGELIDGFEDAIVGMETGQSKTITLTPADAYGEHSEEMIIDIPRSQLPEDLEPEQGMELELTGEDDEQILVIISQISEEFVTLDGNHPLAGKTLTFELELVGIGQ